MPKSKSTTPKAKKVVEKTKPIGAIHPSGSMFFRHHIGTASKGKLTYVLSNGATNGEPLVRSELTGKYFTLTWDDIIQLAVQAGIDE